ncbi:glycosyltransferase family 2 protein [uncultured Corynebacterium sp.]|uniref:glycosyltransferase family 2 protein n=1 Tax=uncultured Corynebacterium sp. TaxID=159447 RepID=UPI0025D356C5|nr:glycosyltransferase family 2 protein [uncultured Corynebacterium sp.]
MTDSGPAVPLCGVSVVIPSLDEQANLAELLPRLPPDLDIVIVEGGDEARTTAVATGCSPTARVIPQARIGKGNALVAGVAAVTGDVVVLLDADCSADPGEIPAFVAALNAGADMAKGSRYLATGGSVDLTRLRSSGNLVLTTVVNLLFRRRFTDLCYGYNAFRTAAFGRLALPDPHVRGDKCWGDGFEIETLFACRAAAAGLHIAEVPSFENRRLHGRSNLNAWSDGWRVLFTLVREWARATLPVDEHRLPRIRGWMPRAPRKHTFH